MGLSRYVLIFFGAMYAFHCFMAFVVGKGSEKNWFYITQEIFMLLFHATGCIVLSITSKSIEILTIGAFQEVMLIAVIVLYRIIYPECSRLLINNLCMLLAIGFVILARLDQSKAVKQFIIAAVSLAVTLPIPYIVMKLKELRRYTYVFGAAGLIAISAVMVSGAVTNGSKLSWQVAGITFQPSEFVKLLYVIFLAGMFTEEDEETGRVVLKPSMPRLIAGLAAAFAHIVVLVLSKDLGSALIFFIVCLFMLYASVKAPIVLAGGVVAGAAGSVIGYKLFSHVRVRVTAWLDPFKVIEGQGYQITQSLFAIGTGGWFGMGLNMGSPNKIPVVDRDFIFAAISEEFGCIFGICLIFICMSTFLMIINMAMSVKDPYYRLIALGFAAYYAFQIFLAIGGTIKFIPMTGVTLPLVSYGGSSVLSTLVMLSVVQGIYLIHETDGKAATYELRGGYAG